MKSRPSGKLINYRIMSIDADGKGNQTNLSHSPAGVESILILPGDIHIRGDLDARRGSRVPRDCPVFYPSIRLEICSSAEQDGRCPVIGGCHREHSGSGRCGINADGVWNIVDVVFRIALVVKDFGLEFRLDEQVSTRQEPSQGEKVDGHRVGENVEHCWLALRRPVLECWVILIGRVDVAAPQASAENDGGPVLERFQGRIPSPCGHVQSRIVKPITVAVVARVQYSESKDQRHATTHAKGPTHLKALPPSQFSYGPVHEST
jgi:hypothetical protein